MANQTITASANHDALTGRLAGETITIQQNAKLTIDSYPQETAMGILGDVNITDGEVHIDGRYVREVVYASGTGTLPAIGAALTYGTAGTAKVIFKNSGTATSGTITITIQGVFEEPNGTITDGSWSATVSSSRQGLLKVFCTNQQWDAVSATGTLRITGDWYEIGVGTGADNQVINLPHTGHQGAVWVETGNGTNVFEIWHRVTAVATAVYYSGTSMWGNTYESGYVFTCVPLSGVLTFGTSTNGGAPPSGARIRIPSVHMGTTTTGSPQTEVTSNTTNTQYADIVDSNVTENVFIDHLNASSVLLTFSGTGDTVLTDSCLPLTGTSTFITVNSAITITNCAWVFGNGLAGETLGAQFRITDCFGGTTIQDNVFYGGTAAGVGQVILMETSGNITFSGVNKIVSNRQNAAGVRCLTGNTSSVITNVGTLLFLNGGINLVGGCTNWDFGDVAYGQLSTRAAGNNLIFGLLAASTGLTFNSGRLLSGALIEIFRGNQFQLTDCGDVLVQNFGAVDAKIDGGGNGSFVANFIGISNNIIFRRVYYRNLAAAQGFAFTAANSDITLENCGSDYDDEIELDATRVDCKGIHGGLGGPGVGVEDDLSNVIATIFLDYFTSDTTGAVGLLFNNRGVRHIPHVDIVAGNPIWNGIGDMLMQTVGDQVIFTWPYVILGHTSLANLAPQIAGVNTGNFDIAYDLDTGDGFSGTFQTANAANLSAETIAPTGFRIKIRITCNTTNFTNSLRGYAILTTTTLAAQKANLYPTETYTITLTGLQAGSEVRFYEGSQSDPSAAQEIDGIESSGTSITLTHSVPGVNAYIVIAAISYVNQVISFSPLSASDQTIPIQQITDRVYSNS
jgi:hypothetical protein